MKSRKSYGRKIKRNKLNLYPKRKTKAQKILHTVLMIILLLLIAFFGYCLGKPLLEYFEKNAGLNETPVWTPPAESTSQAAVSEEVTTTPVETTTAATTVRPVEKEYTYAVEIPSAALANSSALSAYAAKSAAEGCTAAIVLLKDEKGYLRYASQLEILQGTEVITGTLTAKEICSVLESKGLIPVAAISTLSDNAGCAAIPDMSYKVIDEENISWLDYSSGTPVRWANPENKATVDYIGSIVGELRAAGFSEIIQTNIIFPDFQDYDREYIAGRYFDPNRYKMLMGVVTENAYIEVNGVDIVSGNSEILRNKELRNKVVVRINKEDFPAESGYPAEAASLLEMVMNKATGKYSNLQLIPLINRTGFSEDDIEKMHKAAENMGYKEFFIG